MVCGILGIGLLIVGVFVLNSSAAKFRQAFRAEVEQLFAQRNSKAPEIITEAQLAGLPGPVQNWLRNAGVVGKEQVLTVRLKQKGTFRLGEAQIWFPFTAEQYYTTAKPAFIWFTEMKVAPFISITGQDRYVEGQGNLLIKFLSFFNLANVSGYEINQGTLLRYLNEMTWFPTAALSDYIVWEPVDEQTAKATMSYGNVTASALFQFNTAGELVNMTAERYRTVGKSFELAPWSTPPKRHAVLQGLRIPVEGEGIWHLKGGDLPYIRLEVTEIEYNKPLVY
jgi:hypothetical protein